MYNIAILINPNFEKAYVNKGINILIRQYTSLTWKI